VSQNSLSSLPAAGFSPESIPHFVEEMGPLLEANMEPGEFFSAYLTRLVSAAQAVGGAVWQRPGDKAFALVHAQNWHALLLEEIPDGPACHAQVLEVAARRERALWVPPHSGRKLVGDQQAANLSALGLLLAPVVIAKQVVGLVEMWLEPGIETAQRNDLARFLTEVAGFVAAFWQKNQLQSLLQQQQLWNEWTTFDRRLHSNLDPTVVAQWVAGEGRRLLQCDQVSVAISWNGTAKVTALSGTSTIERSSPLVQALQSLCDSALKWGDKLIYEGKRDDKLPAAVAHALDRYLAESNATVLVAWPLADARQAEAGKSCGVLVAEAHDPALSVPRLLERMQTLADHCEPALANARYIARMPLSKLSQTLAKIRDWTTGKRLARLGVYALPVLLILGVLTFVQIPLRLEAKGQLLPVQRQFVYAPLTGKVIELKVRHGDHVDKGQELLLIEDLDSQLQIDQLAIKISSAEQRIALLGDQLAKNTNSEERNQLTKERINQEYEMRKAMAERDIHLQGSRSPRKAPVVAPLAGKVVTFDVQEQLLGKTVKPGDSLLRVAAIQGIWEIELEIPERNLGPIREGLRTAKTGFVEVDLLLANQPHRTFKGRLYREGLGGETTVKDNNVVLPARVQIDDAELAGLLETMPVGLEVRTKVHCGSRPIGHVWFYEIWEFVYEHLLF
jgi:biotin carboxyl carrier protein